MGYLTSATCFGYDTTSLSVMVTWTISSWAQQQIKNIQLPGQYLEATASNDMILLSENSWESSLALAAAVFSFAFTSSTVTSIGLSGNCWFSLLSELLVEAPWSGEQYNFTQYPCVCILHAKSFKHDSAHSNYFFTLNWMQTSCTPIVVLMLLTAYPSSLQTLSLSATMLFLSYSVDQLITQTKGKTQFNSKRLTSGNGNQSHLCTFYDWQKSNH